MVKRNYRINQRLVMKLRPVISPDSCYRILIYLVSLFLYDVCCAFNAFFYLGHKSANNNVNQPNFEIKGHKDSVLDADSSSTKSGKFYYII